MSAGNSLIAEGLTFGLARLADAGQIASMSRDLIETGLQWSWVPERVAHQIRCPDTVVVVARDQSSVIGFAIMQFFAEHAHLNLLGVDRSYQHLGVGRRVIEWLEKSARVAGVFTVRLEVRATNRNARAFYRKLGYREVSRLQRYYCNRETGIRMTRDLRINH